MFVRQVRSSIGTFVEGSSVERVAAVNPFFALIYLFAHMKVVLSTRVSFSRYLNVNGYFARHSRKRVRRIDAGSYGQYCVYAF